MICGSLPAQGLETEMITALQTQSCESAVDYESFTFYLRTMKEVI